MAIDNGSETLTASNKRRTWRFEGFTELGQPYQLRVFREDVIELSDGTHMVKNREMSPLAIAPQDLPTLASFTELPLELQFQFPDLASLENMLTILPKLIAATCDALDRKSQAEKASAETIATEEPTSNPIS